MTKFSFESKLDRAYQHLKELRTKIDGWVKNRPYRLTDKLDANSGDNIISGQLLRPMPPLISQLVGDCLQNLRSSLDHLAYALAIANKGSLTDAEAIKTAFPIFRYAAGFEDRRMRKIGNLSSKAQAIIKRLQPCYTKNPASHVLWHLETLNNIDKHRRMLISATSLIGAGVHQPPKSHMDFWEWSGDGAFSEGETELARYRCINPETSKRVKVEFRPTLIIVFGDITIEERIVQILLDNIGRWIGQVILPKLRPLL